MEKKKITVWKNGKHTGFTHKSSKEMKQHTKKNHKQETLEKSGPVPMFARPIDHQQKIKQFPQQKRHDIRTFKPIIIAVISALVIGTGLGVIMLNMITNINDHVSNGSAQHVSPVTDNSDTHTEETSDQIEVTLDAISAYILQGGVFSEQENAEASADLFQAAGFPTSIWNRDDNYYLLIGATKTKDQAEELALELEQQSLDVFVKEWSTTDHDISLTEEEHRWIQSFVTTWNETLDVVSQNGDFPIEKWQKLADEYSGDSTLLSEISLHVDHVVATNGEENSILKKQHLLMEMWKEYESLNNTS